MTSLAAVEPKYTSPFATAWRFLPLMRTFVPPLNGPTSGFADVIVGVLEPLATATPATLAVARLAPRAIAIAINLTRLIGALPAFWPILRARQGDVHIVKIGEPRRVAARVPAAGCAGLAFAGRRQW